MMKKLTLISVVFLVFGIVLGGPLVAEGAIIQSLVIGVKQDSEGGFTNADLNGTYLYKGLFFFNFEDSNICSNNAYGSVTFDGNGNWSGTMNSFNSDGHTHSSTRNGPYNVNPDGSYEFIIKGAPPDSDQTLTGHISRDTDRQFGVLSRSEVSWETHINQGMVTVVRAPDNPFDMSDLNGTWQFRGLGLFDFEEDFRESRACTCIFEINNPNWTLNCNCFKSDGTTDIDTDSGTYTLSGNNFNFFRTGNPAVAFSAYLSRDSNILIFTDGYSSGGEICMSTGIALKKTTKIFTNTDLSGTYFFHDTVFENLEDDNREASIDVGTVTFDGNGNWTGTVQYFDSDGTSGSDNISGIYSVNYDGSFTFVTSDTPNSTLTGNISGDNNTIILSERENISVNDDGWATISGSVTYKGSPVCAMVLANGQYMFTCAEGENFGKYELYVPLDSNGEITVQAFVSGLAPFRMTTDRSDLNMDIDMQPTSPERQSPAVTTVIESDSTTLAGWARITGTVDLDGTPLCAMVLANGQYMFSCVANNGIYDLTVPLDGNGNITLYVFVSGLRPYKLTFEP